MHAHAFHADAGADAIYIAIAAEDGDLGALACFPGAAFDNYGVVVDLRHFLLKKAHNQIGRGARDHNSGVFAGLLNGLNNAADALPDTEIFQLRLFLLRDTRFGFAKIADQVLALNALHHAVDQFADTIIIFGENGFALSLAHFLQNDLLCSLRGNAAKSVRSFRKAQF